MTNIVDWSTTRPRSHEMADYIMQVQVSLPETVFIYHVGTSGAPGPFKEIFASLAEAGKVHLVQKPLDQEKIRRFSYMAIRSSR